MRKIRSEKTDSDYYCSPKATAKQTIDRQVNKIKNACSAQSQDIGAGALNF